MSTTHAASDAQAIVLSEINRIPGPKKKTPTGYSIRCPFHKDRTPSCSLNTTVGLQHKGRTVPVGYFHCFGCSEGHGPWNKLADRLGLRKIGSTDDEVVSVFVHRELDDFVSATEPQSVEDLMERWEIEEWSKLHSEDEWRSFTGKFLKQFKALKALDKYGKPVMVLPVMVGKDLVGGIKCRWQKREGQLSYINSKGRWTRESGLWPYDYVQRMKPRCVWLVEGPRDAMRLLKYGIPALCMLGTQNWSEAKRDLVLALGVERVVSFTDGDKAGREAAYIIEDSFSDLIDLRLIKMWRLTKKLGLKKLDPFECPKKHLRRYVAKHHLQ